MGLSRLDNFLKSVRGNIIYVDPNSLDSTDSLENRGNSLSRPFKTIQRSLVEAARFSYQSGQDNDRFNRTTILLYPGDHIVDNRPGYIPETDGSFSTIGGLTGLTDLTEWSLSTNLDLTSTNNALYKMNSVQGGIIIPRGTSIVGMDLRKTKIRPTFVPDPSNSNVERTAIFRVTGGCYFWQFTVLDADPNGTCFKDYTTSKSTPNFSHHKLTTFEYADGVNPVTPYSATRTDLDMYYEKIALVYGNNSGDRILPDPNYSESPVVDIQPVIDEFRIVGPGSREVGITSITASGTTVTVTTSSEISDISVDSPIQISGVDGGSVSGFDGQFLIYSITNSNVLQYKVGVAPTAPILPVTPANGKLNLVVDTVTSASPYIFNISLRSVYGMCGLHADGDKASGFKSMVISQFTGIGLQKDDNAFTKYSPTSGTYSPGINLYSDSRSVFKPEYENYHVKASNNAFLQLVSVFAIGYAKHFVVESGGDQSITNSNSNFGAKALISKGFRKNSFAKDDVGYITHIIPPQEIETEETSINFSSIDVSLTDVVTNNTRLYLYNETNADIPPSNVIDGYRVGAKENDTLFIKVSNSGITTEYSARIVMPNTSISKEKVYDIAKSGVDNDINLSTYVITLTSNHNLETGEKVRVLSDTGHLPDGIESNQIYYAIASGVGISGLTQLKLAQTRTNAFLDSAIEIKNKNGGTLQISSKVSDKNSGDIGHPIQWDSSNSNWYINVESNNEIFTLIVNEGFVGLGAATPRSYLKRIPENRNIEDTIYKFRYVISKDSQNARPPLDGYIIQESNTTSGLSTSEVLKYYSSSVSDLNSIELRNLRFIADANWSTNIAVITTELPHDLRIGSEVEVLNIQSTNNPNGNADSGFNGTFVVSEISSPRHFSYSLISDPGTFSNDTSLSNRDENLPVYKRKKLNTIFQIYSSEEIQKYVKDTQDGIYHLVITNNSNSPNVDPFTDQNFSQPIQNLYPQTNRDNPKSNPEESVCFALPNPIGQVVVDDPEKSITKETLNKFFDDLNVGVGIVNIISNSAGTAHTIFTDISHGLSGINSVSIVSGGSSYIQGTYYAADLVGFAGSTTGVGANAKIVVGSGGTVTSIVIMDSGSAYKIGNTLSIIPSAGIGTTTGFVPAVVSVSAVYNNIGDSISVSGVAGTFKDYNTSYRITGINTAKEIVVASASTISPAITAGVGSISTSQAVFIPTGKSTQVSSFTYDSSLGLATIGFSESHGFIVNDKIKIGGVDDDYFNKDAVIKKVVGLSTVVVNVGKDGAGLSTSGTIYVYPNGFTSKGGPISKDNENLGGRLTTRYAGITTSISVSILASSVGTLTIPNAISTGLRVGDYLQIDREIFRIKSSVTSNNVSVHRALFGTPRETHSANSVVRRIKVYPVELRRNSIIRASGHTFEYIGFGPGNYSTALPDQQDRELSIQEEQFSQASRVDGGIINFTAMNSDGDFYTGNKKINSATGQEETYDSPVPNVTGEEKNTFGADVSKTSEIYINRSLKVEGGPEKNLISEFEGPVVFSEKITSTSNKGIEAKSLFIQGNEDVSRNISISTSIPTISGNYGDVKIHAEPKLNENVGWIYTTDNEWKQWGWIRSENAPLYAVGVSSNKGPIGISSLIDFVGTGVSISVSHDSLSGISTVLVKGDPVNYIGITSEGSFIGLATSIEFIGADDGFGLQVNVDFNPSSGIATIILDTPINTVNFGSGILGYGVPSFASTSVGTRVVYENTLNGTDSTNYASGVGNNSSLWWSLPNNSLYSFKWYGGETEVASLLSSGALTILGDSTVTAGQFISTVTTGTSPISVASSTLVSNLNSNYLGGYVSAATTTPNTIVRRDASNNINGNVSHLIHNTSGSQRGEWYADIPARLGYTPFNVAGDICTGISTFNELTTLKKVSDIYTNTSTGIGTTLTCNFNNGPIARSTSSNIGVIDIVNVPEIDGRAFNYTVGITTTSSVSNLADIEFMVNGSSITTGSNRLLWLNNITPTGITSGYYMMGFSIFRVSNNWEVLGVFANYS